MGERTESKKEGAQEEKRKKRRKGKMMRQEVEMGTNQMWGGAMRRAEEEVDGEERRKLGGECHVFSGTSRIWPSAGFMSAPQIYGPLPSFATSCCELTTCSKTREHDEVKDTRRWGQLS